MSDIKYYHCCVQYYKEQESCCKNELSGDSPPLVLNLIRHMIVEDWRIKNRLFPMGTFIEEMNSSCHMHYVAFKNDLLGSITVCEIEKNEARKLRELPGWCGLDIKI